jgi:hypothetical protein
MSWATSVSRPPAPTDGIASTNREHVPVSRLPPDAKHTLSAEACNMQIIWLLWASQFHSRITLEDGINKDMMGHNMLHV